MPVETAVLRALRGESQPTTASLRSRPCAQCGALAGAPCRPVGLIGVHLARLEAAGIRPRVR